MAHPVGLFWRIRSTAVARCIPILFGMLSAGCLRTPLASTPLSEPTFRLAALGQRPVRVTVIGPAAPRSVGHQFLMVAIPFGRIELSDPVKAVERAAFAELAVAGIRPVIGPAGAGLPTVELRLKDASVSAFDFIVTRRVAAAVTVEAALHRAGSPTERIVVERSGDSSSLERFGFTPQLSAAFDDALHSAVRDAVLALQTSGAFR